MQTLSNRNNSTLTYIKHSKSMQSYTTYKNLKMQTLSNCNNSTLTYIKRSNSMQGLNNCNNSTQTSSQLNNPKTDSDEPQQRSPEFNQSLPYLARLSISTPTALTIKPSGGLRHLRE